MPASTSLTLVARLNDFSLTYHYILYAKLIKAMKKS